MCSSHLSLPAAPRADPTPAYDIWQRPDTPESCTSLDSTSLKEHLACDFSEAAESDSDRTVTPDCTDSSRGPSPSASSFVSGRTTGSSYLPQLSRVDSPKILPAANKNSLQRDVFFDSRPSSRSQSVQSLRSYRSGPYGDSFRNTPELNSFSAIPQVPNLVRPISNSSQTLKWSVDPDKLVPIFTPPPKKIASPVKVLSGKIPPINSSHASPSKASLSSVQLQPLIDCQSEARKLTSYADHSQHDFYF